MAPTGDDEQDTDATNDKKVDNIMDTPAYESLYGKSEADQVPEDEAKVEDDAGNESDEGEESDKGEEPDEGQESGENGGDGEGDDTLSLTDYIEAHLRSAGALSDDESLDPDEISGLTIKTKVNHEDREYSVGDLVENARLIDVSRQIFDQAKQMRESLAEAHENAQQVQQQYEVAKQTTEEAEDLFEEHLKAIKEEDPVRYANLRMEFERSVRAIKDKIAKGENEAKSGSESVSGALNDQQLREAVAKRQQAIVDAVPEFQDSEFAKTEGAKLFNYLKAQEYSEQDIATGTDPRAYINAWKAMKWDESQKKRGNLKKKKVAKKPKVLKPGAGKKQEQGGDKPKNPVDILYGRK